jgi:hypothetical protein
VRQGVCAVRVCCACFVVYGAGQLALSAEIEVVLHLAKATTEVMGVLQ